MKTPLAMCAAIFIAVLAYGCYGELLHSDDLQYLGAFRLPDEGEYGWNYAGFAATFYPGGDPTGPIDGYPGSIFALGHDHLQEVSEITIPVPIISPSQNVNDLNTSQTLQGFHDITGGMFGDLEQPTAGLAYLSAQGAQTTEKLHFCWGQMQNSQDFEPSHGWCEMDLSNPQPAGPWYFDGYTNYTTCDYMFEIPEAWASQNTPGQLLVTGRFRIGQWGGLGPTLFAYGPWNDGNPPDPNSTLETLTPLLLYGIQMPGAPEIATDDSMKMNHFKTADDWSGGAWLTKGNRSAVVLLGTKALGNSWYGFADGTVWPEKPPYPDVPPWPYDDRGYWSDSTKTQVLFFDPSELAAVAGGDIPTWAPQPYDSLDIDEYLFDPVFDPYRAKYHFVGATCFDGANGFIYIFERRADEEKCLVHVWSITTGSGTNEPETGVTPFKLHQNYPNPFRARTAICYQIAQPMHVRLTILNAADQVVKELSAGYQRPGAHRVIWDGTNQRGIALASGVYFCRIHDRRNKSHAVKPMLLLR